MELSAQVAARDITEPIANGLLEVKEFQDGKIELNSLDSLIDELYDELGLS